MSLGVRNVCYNSVWEIYYHQIKPKENPKKPEGPNITKIIE